MAECFKRYCNKKDTQRRNQEGSFVASPTKGLKKTIAEAGNHSVEQLAQEEN